MKNMKKAIFKPIAAILPHGKIKNIMSFAEEAGIFGDTMLTRNIYITDKDMRRLRELIMVARQFKKEEEKHLQELETKLNRAKIIKPQDVPSDVITMNSEVHLQDLNTKEKITYRLVFVTQAYARQGQISILDPIGTALLGCRVDDVIKWEEPVGIAKLKVEKILYQPETNGKDI